MTDALLIFVSEHWKLVACFVAVAIGGLTGPFIRVGGEEPHNYDARLAEHEARLAQEHAERELEQRPRVRAGSEV